MIHLGNQEEIDKSRNDIKTQIADNFVNKDIVKAMNPTEFEESYPADKYERYSLEAVKKFYEDFNKSEDADEEVLVENLKDLKKVIVSDGVRISDVFVREIPTEE